MGEINDIRILIKIRCKQNSKRNIVFEYVSILSICRAIAYAILYHYQRFLLDFHFQRNFVFLRISFFLVMRVQWVYFFHTVHSSKCG